MRRTLRTERQRSQRRGQGSNGESLTSRGRASGKRLLLPLLTTDQRTGPANAPPTGHTQGRPFAVLGVLFVVTAGFLLSLFVLSRGVQSGPEALGAMESALWHLSLAHLLRRGLPIFLGSGAFLLALSTLVLVILVLWSTLILLRSPSKSTGLLLTPFTFGLPTEEVQFSSSSGSSQGLYIPRTDARTTIIVCSPGSYADVLGICSHLWLAGHTVFVFAAGGQRTARKGVPCSWGVRALNDFLGAVAYAKMRAPHARIGALGYAMGGAIALLGAAQTSEVEAVVADSACATPWSVVEATIRRRLHLPQDAGRWFFLLLRFLTDPLLWLRTGTRLYQVEPVRVIKQIAPRPVLLLHGLSDTTVPPHDAQLLYQRAGKPKMLWLLPNTEHLGGYALDSAAYVERLTTFFEQRLLTAPPPPAQAQAQETETGPTESQEHREHRSAPLRVPAASHYQRTPSTDVMTLSAHDAASTNGAKKQDMLQQTEAEEKLREIFAQVLDLPAESITCTSDFFQLGGDSDSLERLLSATEKTFAFPLTPTDLFQNPVIFRLAASLVRKGQPKTLPFPERVRTAGPALVLSHQGEGERNPLPLHGDLQRQLPTPSSPESTVFFDT